MDEMARSVALRSNGLGMDDSSGKFSVRLVSGAKAHV